jgi:hypothetical protein
MNESYEAIRISSDSQGDDRWCQYSVHLPAHVLKKFFFIRQDLVI